MSNMKIQQKTIFFVAIIFPILLWAQVPIVEVVDIAGGFDSPVSVTNAGDGSNRLFVTEQGGEIKIVEASGNHIDTPFLNINTLITTGGERGLLGLAFHPNYEVNGFFYVNYTDLNGNTVVDRFTVSADPNLANINTRHQILAFDQPYGNHNGGDLHFGPLDGFLYISTGDGGEAGEAQNLNSLLGNILRIDINGDDFPADATKNYAIPIDNPYVADMNAANEIWVSGLRNPWRFSLDRLNGNLYIGDVGEDAFEEFNFQLATSTGGENYGWPCYEGTSIFSTTGCGTISKYTFPFDALAHGLPHSNYCTAVGGFVYRGLSYNYLNGWYFYTDWCDGEFFIARQLGNDMWEIHSLGTLIGGFAVTGFGESETGELFLVAWSGLFQIIGERLFENGFESN
jgi:hypothetical protein